MHQNDMPLVHTVHNGHNRRMRIVEGSKSMGVRMPQATWDRISALASATRRSRSDIVREAVDAEIDRLEWTYRVADLARAVRAGEEPTRPLAELMAEVGRAG